MAWTWFTAMVCQPLSRRIDMISIKVFTFEKWVDASPKMAINKWVNGTPLKAFLGDENGNECYYLVQGNQHVIPLV